jgi:hypothetical protein
MQIHCSLLLFFRQGTYAHALPPIWVKDMIWVVYGRSLKKEISIIVFSAFILVLKRKKGTTYNLFLSVVLINKLNLSKD